MHSARIELTKLIIVGTRVSYQATGDAYSSARAMRSSTDNKYTIATQLFCPESLSSMGASVPGHGEKRSDPPTMQWLLTGSHYHLLPGIVLHARTE